MIIGAPGVYAWTGAVIRVSDYLVFSPTGKPSRRKRQAGRRVGVIDFGETFVPDVSNIPQLRPNDYFGKRRARFAISFVYF